MSDQRPYVLSIAGFDPSAGAGVLADVKVMEQCEVYGMGVVSALTVQNDISFEKVNWRSVDEITDEIKLLQKRFQFSHVKIGLIENMSALEEIISFFNNPLYALRSPICIWDPIIRSSSGFDFHNTIVKKDLISVLEKTFLITPNVEEAVFLTGLTNPKDAAKQLSEYCNVLLKGGHNETEKGVDFLYLEKGDCIELKPIASDLSEKHGSGCVLSAAITANLALGLDIKQACIEAKKYVTGFLSSTDSLLGYHSNLSVEHE